MVGVDLGLLQSSKGPESLSNFCDGDILWLPSISHVPQFRFCWLPVGSSTTANQANHRSAMNSNEIKVSTLSFLKFMERKNRNEGLKWNRKNRNEDLKRVNSQLNSQSFKQAVLKILAHKYCFYELQDCHNFCLANSKMVLPYDMEKNESRINSNQQRIYWIIPLNGHCIK